MNPGPADAGAGMLSDSRPSALLLAPEPPYPSVGGGAIRTACLFEHLARRYSLDVIVFRQPGEPDPGAAFPPGLVRRVQVIDLPYHVRHVAARAGRNLARYVGGRPPLNDRFAGFAGPIQAFLRDQCYDLAVIEHFWCAPYWEQVAPQAANTVLDLHNIESVLYGRYAQVEGWPAAPLFRRFSRICREMERCWFPKFSLLLVTSEQDADRVREIAPGTSPCIYPNTIPYTPPPNLPEADVVIFSGNLEYPPNVSAVRFFRREIWPLLRERWPSLVWRLVGKNPGGVTRYISDDPRIEVSGPVTDAVQALAAARVVVVPLLAGSGTRLKILEAWAAARAVVSTRLGTEGLPARDGEHLLLADTPRAFAGAVSLLLGSPEERLRLGRAGRKLYESGFTWEQAWLNLVRIGI